MFLVRFSRSSWRGFPGSKLTSAVCCADPTLSTVARERVASGPLDDVCDRSRGDTKITHDVVRVKVQQRHQHIQSVLQTSSTSCERPRQQAKCSKIMDNLQNTRVAEQTQHRRRGVGKHGIRTNDKRETTKHRTMRGYKRITSTIECNREKEESRGVTAMKNITFRNGISVQVWGRRVVEVCVAQIYGMVLVSSLSTTH